jgi:amidase
MADLHELSLTELAGRLHTREVSPVAATEAYLARIEAREPELRAFVTVTAETALAQARAAEAELLRGPAKSRVHGVPLALKDLVATRDAPTRAGTIVHTAWQAGADAEVAARLRAAGAVFLGKLKTTEGAMAAHHPDVPAPVNPWGRELWTGVSSSGSGVATAARLCAGALGTDTGGSIRFPSHACGVTGLKPTWGRVSRRGVFPLADSLDHVGPMARSAADAAAILGVVAGRDPGDPTSLVAPVPDYTAELSRGARGLRVGFDEADFAGVAAPVAAALADARDALRAAGAEIVPVRVPPRIAIAARWLTLCAPEAALAHAETFPARRSEYGPSLAQILDLGIALPARDYAQAHAARLAFSGALAEVFAKVDLFLSPSWPWTSRTTRDLEALPLADSIAMVSYTAPYDASGSPTLSLPAGLDERGGPFGFQLVGRHLAEPELLRAGHAYQQATAWHRAAPPERGRRQEGDRQEGDGPFC